MRTHIQAQTHTYTHTQTYTYTYMSIDTRMYTRLYLHTRARKSTHPCRYFMGFWYALMAVAGYTHM